MSHESIANDQMDLNSLMVCAIYFGVDVLKGNPALTRLPLNVYGHLFTKFVFCHSHVDEAVVSYLRSVTMNAVSALSSFGATSKPLRGTPDACASTSSSRSSPSRAKAAKTLSVSADERRSLETTSAGVSFATAPISEFLANNSLVLSNGNCEKPARRSKLTLGGRLKDATIARTRIADRDNCVDSDESL